MQLQRRQEGPGRGVASRKQSRAGHPQLGDGAGAVEGLNGARICSQAARLRELKAGDG